MYRGMSNLAVSSVVNVNVKDEGKEIDEDDHENLICSTRDPLLSSSNVLMQPTADNKPTIASPSTPLNSLLLFSPLSTPIWSPVSTALNSQLNSATNSLTPNIFSGLKSHGELEDLEQTPEVQTPEVQGEVVIGGEESDVDGRLYIDDAWTHTGSGRPRTPRTLTRLMEQHRENERHRHNGLNDTIHDICSLIPGYNPFVRETKIVKLQRIISYISHMESNIQKLCDDMGIVLDFKNIFLSSHSDNSNTSHKKSSPRPQSCSMDSAAASIVQRLYEPETPIPYSISRKLKLCSPSVNSTTAEFRSLFPKCSDTDQRTHNKPSMLTGEEPAEELEWLQGCTGLESPDTTILTPDDCDQILSSLDVNLPSDLHSPYGRESGHDDSSVPSTPRANIHGSCKSSRKTSTQHRCHFDRTDACVPTTPVTPLRRSQRRRILRSPLRKLATLFRDSSPELDDEENDEDFKCSAVPREWFRHDETKPSKGTVSPSATNVNEENASRGRVDHRKTSWMNGFMMFSRLHRRSYINDNPGVHTSYISKLMGHDWRTMTHEQQRPYKERAQQYVKQYLKPDVSPPMSLVMSSLHNDDHDVPISSSDLVSSLCPSTPTLPRPPAHYLTQLTSSPRKRSAQQRSPTDYSPTKIPLMTGTSAAHMASSVTMVTPDKNSATLKYHKGRTFDDDITDINNSVESCVEAFGKQATSDDDPPNTHKLDE